MAARVLPVQIADGDIGDRVVVEAGAEAGLRVLPRPLPRLELLALPRTKLLRETSANEQRRSADVSDLPLFATAWPC